MTERHRHHDPEHPDERDLLDDDAVAALLRETPVEVDTAARDVAVAAALAAFDETRSADRYGVAETDDRPDDSAATRSTPSARRPARRRSVTAPVLVAAALVLVVAIAGTVRWGASSGDESADSAGFAEVSSELGGDAEPSAADAGSDSDDGGDAEHATAAAPEDTASEDRDTAVLSSRRQLGDAATAAALLDRTAALLGDVPPSTQQASGGPTQDAAGDGLADGGASRAGCELPAGAVEVLDGSIGGAPVIVVVTVGSDGLLLSALDRSNCRVLDERPL